MEEATGFESLRDVLDAAYHQAAHGKGQERHGGGLPFTEQPIFSLIRDHGVGFATGQAAKKLAESHRLPPDAARRELLGAIVYAAAAYIAFLDEDKRRMKGQIRFLAGEDLPLKEAKEGASASRRELPPYSWKRSAGEEERPAPESNADRRGEP